ncbi:MAG: endolytic transglycosylase MltG [Mariprofundaceae bacterium]
MRRRVAIGLALAALLLAAACGIWLWQALHAPLAPSNPVEIEIPKGASGARVARLLHARGVIASERLFLLAARLSGRAGQLQSGFYRFAEPASVLQIIDRLARGDVLVRQVTVPEGLRTDEILALLAARTGVPLARWQAALDALLPGGVDAQEGRLLPETWRWTPPLDPRRLLARMIAAQETLIDALLGRDADPVARRRLRIIASIIEKETSLDAERPLVAAVIRNRLQRNMALQMDPTVIYGIWRTRGAFSGNLHKRDLLADTPWNTYTRRGLPPTPICNPGRASLVAAAHPADVDYLYFVADGTGGHAFASSLAEHERNVRRWVRIERSRNREEKP